jgi:luciferase family oxidoreductase group 1
MTMPDPAPATLDSAHLSVLDLSPIATGQTVADALRRTLELAVWADLTGFRRYWVAEHHNVAALASTSTAVMVALIAERTARIRVGAGGMMLPNHPPLVIAEQYGALEALYPGRIDLGLGRSPGTDPAGAAALRRPHETDFGTELDRLLSHFGAPTGAEVRAITAEGNRPEPWVLGSSTSNAPLAGRRGLPFAHAHFLNPDTMVEAVRSYRAHFRPSSVLTRPYVAIAPSVICADTDHRARAIARSNRLHVLRMLDGSAGTLPSQHEADAHRFTTEQERLLDQRIGHHIAGSPQTVRAGLRELLAATGADELIIMAMIPDPGDRIRSYQLLAAPSD